ncbi:MAG: glutamate--tRNA ligase [Anaerolineae bacterium]|nr:glutamate--tRNA ligase [Anaerolineae bacterium]
MSSRPIRTRFAPSPTGSLHIGGLRTALFNWMFARQHGGQFILRIEDTDQKRFDPTALQTLIEALRWCGLSWDEGPEVGGALGPYVQSERLAHYHRWANWLIDQGKAYKCFCTPERLEQVNREKAARKEPPGYDRFCRSLTPEQIAEKEARGEKYVVRFKMPLEGQTIVHDLIRGDVAFENHTIQDMVLLKSDGFPTYHLAVVVDDHLMEITHVMRAVEWLPSFPLHVQIWQAFGWQMPQFAHLPVILNPNGKGKLSKRNPPRDKHGHVIPVFVHDYMQAGYLPEALDNFLANIGWNFGDNREVFAIAEAIERFDLGRINPANSTFPTEKLDWLNGEHIRRLSATDLAQRLRPLLAAAGLAVNDATLMQVVPVVQTRLKVLNDVVDLAGFLFRDPAAFAAPAADILIQKKLDAATTRRLLEESIRLIETGSAFDHASLHEAFKALAETLAVSNSALFGTLRVAVSAQAISTPTFETMEILGRDETLRRLRLALPVVS